LLKNKKKNIAKKNYNIEIKLFHEIGLL